MICKPCRKAADMVAAINRLHPGKLPAGHDPETCRDHDIQPHGCPCAHGQTHRKDQQ